MANDIVIRAEGLGKKYLIDHQAERERYVALRDVLARSVRSVAKGAVDLLRGRGLHRGGTVEEFWALKDVDFEVRKGEVLGVIGRNGAGKSTLLKILSRITEPSCGRMRITGRVASLLEVGTGFHPELSGRENIYLNGAILGMRQEEIRRKFDEIVAFAEVERFLDTPVKRYSSGMYVRLAFSVAAHLEPDILVVDEVLAVGDVRFQQKCLGKMDEVAKLEGRTVLLVSHNLSAVRSLATSGIVLDQGRLVYSGSTHDALRAYTDSQNERFQDRSEAKAWGKGKHTAIRSLELVDEQGLPTSNYSPGEPFRLVVEFDTDGAAGASLELLLLDHKRDRVALASLHHFHAGALPTEAGRYRCCFDLSRLWLASGTYYLDATTSIVNVTWDHYVESALKFEVLFSNPGGEAWDFKQSFGYGALAWPLSKAAYFVEATGD